MSSALYQVRAVLISDRLDTARLMSVIRSAAGRRPGAAAKRPEPDRLDRITIVGGQSFAPDTVTGRLTGPSRTEPTAAVDGRHLVDEPGAGAGWLTPSRAPDQRSTHSGRQPS